MREPHPTDEEIMQAYKDKIKTYKDNKHMHMRLNDAKKTLLDPKELEDYVSALDVYKLPDGRDSNLMEAPLLGIQNRSSNLSE